MLLSEMLVVERDTDFCVEMFEGKFRIMSSSGRERLYFKSEGGDWSAVTAAWMLYGVIESAPSGIIRLPPPLTDEQREQLKALYTLTFRWIVKNKKGAVVAYSHKPYRYDAYWATEKVDANIQSVAKELSVCSLVSWSDTEPYDIGKALGVEG